MKLQQLFDNLYLIPTYILQCFYAFSNFMNCSLTTYYFI